MKDKQVLKTEDIHAMTEDELNDKLIALRKDQFNTRFQKASGQFENTAQIRKTRRNIARIKTIQHQKNKSAS